MTTFDCPIKGTATAARIHDEPVWTHADPEIHVSDDLLADEMAKRWIEERYSIDEPCPHARYVHHARLHGVTP